ncbi:MAG: DNA-processing protein DprA [Thermovirgaceae bacterium]|nr:DNA-processing protein DprA [Thermovirgaceae bacterium]
MSDTARETLADHAASGWAGAEWDRCEKSGVRLIFFTDEDFPEMLKNTPDPPLVLYVRGKGAPHGEMAAVIGTRRCSPYGAHCAETLGSSLAAAGIAVVSGGARGIDGAAHKGCLASGGRTIAVLGTGVDIAYPGSHRHLFEEIMEEGALLSEYPLGSSGLPWRFPRRNRIIAGLCSRCVVVEAPLRSGAMTTARFALDAGREVWAVPGRITESVCRGSNALISDGAIPLVDIMDFAGIASGVQMSLFPAASDAALRAPSLSDDERSVYGILATRGDMTVDNIASEGKMSAAAVLRVIGVLSAYGLVFRSGSGRWSTGASGNKGSAR